MHHKEFKNSSNMKHLQRIAFLVLALSTLISCNEPNGTVISGNMANANDMSVYLDKITLSEANDIILSKKTDSKGDFSIEIPTTLEAGVYRLRFGAKALEFLTAGNDKKITIKGDLNDLQNYGYTVEGSPLTQEYLDLVHAFGKKEIDTPTLTKTISEKSDPMVSFMVATRMYNFREDFAEVHTAVANRLKEKYPSTYFTNDYVNIASQLEKQKARLEATNIIRVGMDAPDIVLPGPNGKEIALSDYKGKVVLLDFWAAWCRPCRIANPKVVEVYKKYSNKGFEVFSVSLDGLDNRTRSAMSNDENQIKLNLDRQKEKWVAAIQEDNLVWKGHVSDLMKWDSKAAALYGISSIPKTFLIDKDGKIAAIDPRYNLEESLLKFL